MRFLISAAILCFVLAVICSPIQAEVSFQLERSFSIPGLTDTIQQVRFRDVDGDGIPEVLAATRNQVVLYSVTSDSELFGIAADSFNAIETILLDDVDRDSIPDIVIGDTSPFSDLVVTKFSGAGNFGSPVWRSYPRYQSAFDGCVSGPDVVVAPDVDNDGYNELLISNEHVQYTNMGLDFEQTIGEATHYFSFPDSISTQLPYYFRSASPLPMPGGKGNLWLGQSACDFTSGMGIYSLSHSWNANLLDSSGVVHWLSLPNVIPCQFSFYSSTYPEFRGSRVDSAANSTEFLITKHITYQCSGDSSTHRQDLMNMYRIHTGLSVTLDWSVDIGTTTYSSFLFPPDLPGYFFAFTDNSLVIFRETDGSVRAVVSDIPSGTRLWDYPDADGKVRLVTLRGDSISVYTPDVTTGVNNDNRNASIPHSFILGNPYPNPFNPSTSIPVATGPGGRLTLEVYNIAGQRVAKLFDGKVSANQAMICKWNTVEMASGVYFMRALLNGLTATKKLMLLK